MMQPSGAAGFLHRFDGLRGRLPGHRLDWVQALRDQAAANFRDRGLPTRRDEAWRYTDLRALAEIGFEEALTAVDAAPELPIRQGTASAVFVDGRLHPDLSELGDFAGSLAERLHTLQRPLGAVADANLPLVALNTMLFEDGVVIDVPANVAAGVFDLIAVASDTARPMAAHPRHLIRLGAGASLTLIETATGAAARTLHNPVFEIELGEGATLTHARVQREGRNAFHLSTVAVRVAAGATYDNFTLNAGARLARNEIHVALNGPRGTCHMNGAQLVADGQHADTSTYLDHAAPDCASRQTYKSVLAGRARGVFQGKILVRQAAQRTDGYQMNQALLLSDDAEMDSKPQLEIYADDVKCSHGATVGALDADQLFYLRARGIPDATARSMLVEAFLAEAIEGVQDAAARAALEAAAAGWWEREAA